MPTVHFDTNRPDIEDIRNREVVNRNQRQVTAAANRVAPGTNPLTRPSGWEGQLGQRGLAGMGTSAGTFANGQRMGGGVPTNPAARNTQATVTSTPAQPQPSIASVAGTGKPLVTPFGTVSSTTAPVTTATPTPTQQHPSAVFDSQDPRRAALMQAHPEIWKAGSPENLAFVAHVNQFGEQHAHDNLASVLHPQQAPQAASAYTSSASPNEDVPNTPSHTPAAASPTPVSPAPPTSPVASSIRPGSPIDMAGKLAGTASSAIGAGGQWLGNKLAQGGQWLGLTPAAAQTAVKAAQYLTPFTSAASALK